MQLLIDGIDIAEKYNNITVTQDRSSPHNKIEIKSFTPELFNSIDPRILTGTKRIELIHETQSWYFLLEPPIRGDELNFSFGGRSLSAQEDELYAGQMSISLFSLSSPNREAEAVCTSLLTTRTLTWNLIGSMPLPETWSFSGSPLDGVREIATEFGAIVRCSPEGNIIVDHYYSGDPRTTLSADFTLDVDTDIAKNVGYEEIDGLKKNAVIIRSPAEYESPGIEWENNYEQWETAYCRVSWNEPEIKSDPDTFSTAGTLVKDDPFITSAEYTQDVTFQDGVANVSNAMQTLVSFTWKGLDGGTPEWEVGGIELRIAGIGGICTIVYTAKFQRWKLTGANQENILVGFGDPITNATAWDFQLSGLSVINRLDDIESANITTLAGGEARAIADLLATNDKRFLDIEIDMTGRVITDGMIGNIPNEIMELTGLFHVISADMDFREIGMTYKIRLEKWLP